MTVPHVGRRRQIEPPKDGTASFWAAAKYLDTNVGDNAGERAFLGDLSPFGFTPTQRPAEIQKIKDAVVAACEVVPNISFKANDALSQRQDRVRQTLAHFEKANGSQFWFHPSEASFGFTRPFSFNHPYGVASGIVFNMSPVEDRQDQNKRITQLGLLKSAHQTQRKSLHSLRTDAYVAHGEGFNQTFAFAKKHTIGGRDQTSEFACGFALSEGDTNHKFTSPDIPFLYLERVCEEVSV